MGSERYSILQYFAYDHLPADRQEVSKQICELAHEMAETLPNVDETEAGLRKLLEAKDCFVRASIETSRKIGF